MPTASVQPREAAVREIYNLPVVSQQSNMPICDTNNDIISVIHHV